MRLSAPTQTVFFIALLLAVLGLVGYLKPAIPVIGVHEFWFVVAGYGVLAVSTLLRKV